MAAVEGDKTNRFMNVLLMVGFFISQVFPPLQITN